jgi:serralysin
MTENQEHFCSTLNESHYCICLTPDDLSEEDKARLRGHKAALLRGAKWEVGEVITVRFLNDGVNRFGARATELEERIQKVALEWTKLANLNLDFRNGGSTDIRIAFQDGDGSWSYLGTMCRRIKEPDPTMNYGWLTPDSPEDELRRVVLHEFGHALGLIHEHQNPKGGIEWNRDAVIADLSGPPNKWPLSVIEDNIFAKYTDVEATDVDAESIMMYPIPRAWTLDGFSADLNSELSERDKEFIQANYPR